MARRLVARFVDSSERLEREVRRTEALPADSLERSAAVARLTRRFVAFCVAEEQLLFGPIERVGRELPEPVPTLVREQRRLAHRALGLGGTRIAGLDAGFIEELEAHLEAETTRLLPEIESLMKGRHVAPAPVWYADELLSRLGDRADCCPEHWLG